MPSQVRQHSQAQVRTGAMPQAGKVPDEASDEILITS